MDLMHYVSALIVLILSNGTSFNFTFSATEEGVERIPKTVFDLVFSKKT